MTTMIAEVYDALLDAGAGEDKARRAAQALAGHEDRFNGIERRIDSLETTLNRRIDGLEARLDRRLDTLDTKIDGVETRLHGEQVLIRWMLATVLAVLIAVALKTFLH